MFSTLSPKVYGYALVIVAALALRIITGDDQYLIAALLGIVGGAQGVAARPVMGSKVTQKQLISHHG